MLTAIYIFDIYNEMRGFYSAAIVATILVLMALLLLHRLENKILGKPC